MAKKKRKKSPTPPQKFSPRRYIRERARGFPIKACYCNLDWSESGLAQVLVCREQPSGKQLVGIFLIDNFCLGLKNTMHQLNQEDYEVEELRMSMEGTISEISYDLAHNLVYGAIDYAEELGFSPQKDFSLTRYILEEDTEDIELIDLEFGKDGQPYYISGPYDDVPRILNTLNRSVGEGNYHYLAYIGSRMDDW